MLLEQCFSASCQRLEKADKINYSAYIFKCFLKNNMINMQRRANTRRAGFNIKEALKTLLRKTMAPKQFKALEGNWIRMRQFLRPGYYCLIIDTADCNLKCSMCPRGGINGLENPEKGFMSFELLKKIVAKFIDERVKIDNIVFGNWGEPLLNPDLPKMIKFARSKDKFILPNSAVIINTNLTNLPDPTALLESGIDEIRISVSGMTQEIYSRNHRGGNIESVLSNILKLVNVKNVKRLKNIRLKMRFHDYVYNKKDAGMAKKFCDKYGLEFCFLRTYIPSVEDNIEFKKNREKLSEYYSRFIDLNRENSLMSTFDPVNVYYCCYRRNQIVVNFDGQLYRCCGVFEKKYFMGSIFNFKIIDIPQLNSEICKKCAETPISWRY